MPCNRPHFGSITAKGSPKSTTVHSPYLTNNTLAPLKCEKVVRLFFEAQYRRNADHRFRGKPTFTAHYGIIHRNLNSIENDISRDILQPSWLYFPVHDYGVSADRRLPTAAISTANKRRTEAVVGLRPTYLYIYLLFIVVAFQGYYGNDYAHFLDGVHHTRAFVYASAPETRIVSFELFDLSCAGSRMLPQLLKKRHNFSESFDLSRFLPLNQMSFRLCSKFYFVTQTFNMAFISSIV